MDVRGDVAGPGLSAEVASSGCVPAATESQIPLEKMAEVQKLAALQVDEPGENLHSLPPPPADLAGTSAAAGKNYSVTVSNKAGYMCHVHVVADWTLPPEVPFAIFTHPDNSRLFRDIQRVGTRKVIKSEPGYKEVQVEQLGDIQVLWMHRTYSTWLQVAEDTRDPDNLRTTFHLMRSDVLGKFSGDWEMKAVRDPVSGQVVGCHGELHQDVLPKGMPSFMARLPVLGGVLRGISVRAVTRVMDDINIAMDKVRAGHAAGRTTEAVLRELCGSAAETGFSNGHVTSFAFDAAADAEDEEEEEEEVVAGGKAEGGGEEQQQQRDKAGKRHEQEAGGGEATELVDDGEVAAQVASGAAAAGAEADELVSKPAKISGTTGDGRDTLGSAKVVTVVADATIGGPSVAGTSEAVSA